LQECLHLAIEPSRRGCPEMDMFLPDRAGDDRHRARAVVAPSPCPNPRHATTPGGEQGRMPREEPCGGEGLVIAPRHIKHHLDPTLDLAVGALEPADLHAEAARDR